MSTTAPSEPRQVGGAQTKDTAPRKVKPATAGGDRAKKAAIYVGIGVIIVYCLAPFYWMVVTSLRKTAEVFEQSAIPKPPSFENYQSVFDPVNNFGRALLNSIIVAGTTTALCWADAASVLTACLPSRCSGPPWTSACP